MSPLFKIGDVVRYNKLYRFVIKNFNDLPIMIVLGHRKILYTIDKYYYKYKVLLGDKQFEIAEGHIELANES